jgi:hypothetical protein
MYPVTTRGSFARYFLRSVTKPQRRLWFRSLLCSDCCGKNKIRARLLACFSLFVDLFLLIACERPSERAQLCASKQLVAMAPLKAVAVLVGTAGVSGEVHFQQEGEGYGFSLLALLFFSFLFFSFLSCLAVTNRFSVYSLFRGKVFKWPFFLWEMYISFDFFPGF